MIKLEQVPKRVWIGCGAGLALFGGVAAAAAGSMAMHHPSSDAATAESEATPGSQRLQIAFAAPAPLVLPPAPAAGDRMAVLADPPADLANLDPDVRQSADFAALNASLRRYQAENAAAISAYGAYDARPLPTALSIDVPAHPEPIVLHRAAGEPAPAAHDDDVAASGDTGRAQAKPVDANDD